MGRDSSAAEQRSPLVETLNLKIAGIEFSHHHYDDRGDGIEWDENERVIAMTPVNVRWLIERDGELRITWPDGHTTHDAPAEVLPAAA